MFFEKPKMFFYDYDNDTTGRGLDKTAPTATF